MEERSLETLRDELRVFAAAREWDQYHTPKNLAMALIVEAAELVEHFQWLTPEESQSIDGEKREEVRQECADILIYLTRLADVLGIDLVDAAYAKMALNAKRYPAEQCRGSAAKARKE